MTSNNIGSNNTNQRCVAVPKVPHVVTGQDKKLDKSVFELVTYKSSGSHGDGDVPDSGRLDGRLHQLMANKLKQREYISSMWSTLSFCPLLSTLPSVHIRCDRSTICWTKANCVCSLFRNEKKGR